MSKTQIWGAFLILVILSFGFNPEARFRIGSVTLTDTLSGNLKLNNGLWLSSDSINGVTKINTDDVQSGNGIKFSSMTRFIDDDGGTITFNAEDFTFNTEAGVYLGGISSAGNLTLKLTTDSMRIADASKTGRVSNPIGFLRIYVGGEARYIQLYDTP